MTEHPKSNTSVSVRFGFIDVYRKNYFKINPALFSPFFRSKPTGESYSWGIPGITLKKSLPQSRYIAESFIYIGMTGKGGLPAYLRVPPWRPRRPG
jgi:hypothetical protein